MSRHKHLRDKLLCEVCGEQASVVINGLGMCEKPEHIDQVMATVFDPVRFIRTQGSEFRLDAELEE